MLCMEKLLRTTLDSECILLPPKRKLVINAGLRKKLAMALVTRYSPNNLSMKILITTASKYIPTSVHQWGQVQICNRGNRFKSHALLKSRKHTCDCTHVKVSVHPVSFTIPFQLTDPVTSMKQRWIFMNARSTWHW